MEATLITGAVLMGLLLATAVGLVRRHGFADPDERAAMRDRLVGAPNVTRQPRSAATRSQWLLVALFVVGNAVLVSSHSTALEGVGFVLFVGSLLALIVVRLRQRRRTR
jgi:hypothetical protein